MALRSGFIQVRQNLMANAGSSNTIDLTDEDDPKPVQRAQPNPPALVSLNVQKRQQMMSQAQPVQRQLINTQQTIRNITMAQARKLPVVGNVTQNHFTMSKHSINFV